MIEVVQPLTYDGREAIRITPRQAAHLISRLAAPKLSPVAEAASKHEFALRKLFIRSARNAQDAAPMRELEDVLSMGHGGTGSVEYLLEDVLSAWSKELLGDGVEPAPVDWFKMRAAAGNEKDLPSLLNAVLVSGAGAAEVCVASTKANRPFLKTDVRESKRAIKEIQTRATGGAGRVMNIDHLQKMSVEDLQDLDYHYSVIGSAIPRQRIQEELARRGGIV